MTPKVKAFAEKHLKEFSKNNRVLNIGSRVAQGQSKLTPDIQAINIDMQEGENVDYVLDASDVDFAINVGEKSFDAVCSFECLEHCKNWKAVINNMWDTLKDGGILVLSMAAYANGYHGHPHDYVRIEFDEFKRIFDGHEIIDELDHVISIGAAVRKKGKLNINLDDIKTSKPIRSGGVRTK